jgi:hypothetical protein
LRIFERHSPPVELELRQPDADRVRLEEDLGREPVRIKQELDLVEPDQEPALVAAALDRNRPAGLDGLAEDVRPALAGIGGSDR